MVQRRKELGKRTVVMSCFFFITLMGLTALIPNVHTERLDWAIVTVDSTGGGVGEFSSLALDSSDYPHISYFDYIYDDLKYAYKDASGWHKNTVDNIGYVGEYTSLALDSSDYPHISYYDNTYGDLKYAHWDGDNWHNSTVDSAGNVGKYTSIALNSSGYPHISYFDVTNLGLKYTCFYGGSWHTAMVDNVSWVGEFTSIALDAHGNPHISYWDGTYTALKYAYWDGGGWHISTVDNSGDVGYSTSLALNASDYPFISYYDNTNGDLMYAYWDGGGWHISTVDSTGDVGRYSSLALDAQEYPHISYYDNTNGDLMYAYWDGGCWHISTVDSTGDVGFWTSLALDTLGSHISYFDNTNNELKHAWLIPGVDYILVTHGSLNEVADQVVSTNFSLVCYAASFNTTLGFLGFVDAVWNLQDSGWSNASLNTTLGESVEVFSGWHDDTVTVTADDGNGHTDNVTFSMDSTMFSMLFYEGWNLITVPVDTLWTAETVGKNISGCSLVLRFNASRQEFDTHVVGVPYDDFPIVDGVGYFVRVSNDTILTRSNIPITMVNVTVYNGWNTLGWFHEYPSNAQSLGENTNASLVLMYDAITQDFMTYVVNSGYDNFPISRGMAVFIWTNQTGWWHGEG